MAETGRYMYAVSRGLEPAVLEDVAGLDGGRLELVGHEDLVAVVSTVDLEEYGEEGLRRNLENLEWLETAARDHDAVIHAASAAAPTAPLRLATICLDDDGVRRRLREWYAALTQILDRVEGRSEWSVKVFARAEPGPAVPVPTPAPETGGGAAYLQRKKEQARARDADVSSAAETAERVHEALSGVAVAGRRLPAQDPRLSGHEGTMVHNGAYLVDAEAEHLFVQQVEGLVAAHPQVSFDLRGPWPPYSFAMLEQR